MEDHYCRHCGNPNLGESKYCSQCGAAVAVRQWHYFTRNERVGPLAEERMHALCASGLLTPDTLVWREGMADWAPIAATEFASYFQAPLQAVRRSTNDTYAWWLASVPVLAAFTNILFVIVVGTNAFSLWVATIVVHFVLCAQDRKALSHDGRPAPALGWALIVPVYLSIRAAKLRQFPSYAIVWFVSLLCSVILYGAAFGLLETSAGDSGSRAVRIVQNGIMNDYPGRTVEEAAAEFFDSTEWQGFVAEDGLNYVNMEGDAMLNGREIRILLQFVVDVERESFRVFAMSIEGEPQNDEMISLFLDAMYGQGIDPGQVVQIKRELLPHRSLQALAVMG